jgi:hypothetical protein
MADLIDLSEIIAKKGDKPLVLSSVNLQSQEDALLERKLWELKSKQELRKDWILFLLREVVAFSVTRILIFSVAGYFIFTLIRGS